MIWDSLPQWYTDPTWRFALFNTVLSIAGLLVGGVLYSGSNGPRRLSTAICTIAAAAIAYNAFYYWDDLVRAFVPNTPWRGLVLDLGLVVSVVLLFVALSLAEMIYAPLARSIERSRMRRKQRPKPNSQ